MPGHRQSAGLGRHHPRMTVGPAASCPPGLGCLPRAAAVCAALAAALAAGCALAPVPIRRAAAPDVRVPVAWSAGATAASDTIANGPSAATLQPWWQRFDDPLLAALVALALQANTRLATAQGVLLQAQALRDAAAATLQPALGASTSAQRGRANGRSTGNALQLGLDASWSPDLWGERRQAVAAANAALQANAASLGDVQVAVTAEVGLAYISLRNGQARQRIALDNLAIQQQTLQIVLWRQQAGLVTGLDADQAQAALAQTQALLPALATGIRQTRHALAVLTGQAPAALSPLLDGLDAPGPVPGVAAVLGRPAAQAAPSGLAAPMSPMSPTTPATPTTPRAPAEPAANSLALGPLAIPANTLRQRADVRAAEYQLNAALARVAQAEAARRPSLSLSGSLGLAAATVGGLASGSAVLASVLAGMQVPLLDGGAAVAAVRSQQAVWLQSHAAWQASVLAALQQVEDALTALAGDRQRLVSLQSAALSAGRAAVLARQRFSAGLVDFQTVLETQRNALTTQDSLAQAGADAAADLVRLYQALGGGWQDIRAELLLPAGNNSANGTAEPAASAQAIVRPRTPSP